jgi:hypothetical protein
MYTYKFLGLSKKEGPTPYYYGSLQAKAAPGQTLRYDHGENYVIVRVEGEPFVGDDGRHNEKELAWAEIGRGETVPTLWLLQLITEETKFQGRSFDADEVKAWSQKNRKFRLAQSAE